MFWFARRVGSTSPARTLARVYIHVAVRSYIFVFASVRQTQVSARGKRKRDIDIGNRTRERGMIWRRKSSDDSEYEKRRKRKKERRRNRERQRREKDREGGARRRSGLTGRQLLSPTWNIVFHARHNAYARITTRRLMYASPTAWPSINSGVDAHEISGWYHRYRRIEARRKTRRGKEREAAKARNRSPI